MNWRKKLAKSLDLKNNSKHKAILLTLSIFLVLTYINTSYHILTSYLNTNQGQVAAAAWYNSNWDFRKKITIDSTKVDANLTDFPVLINYDEEGDLKQYAKSDGTDILFTSSDGTTKLSHEIETYNNLDGQLVAHVKVPSLSSTTNTELYMYYGNSEAVDQQNVVDVWSNGYAGVWHMDEGQSGIGNADVYKDSTANNNDGYDYVSETGKNGKISAGQEYIRGENGWIDLGNSSELSPTSNITVSAWAYPYTGMTSDSSHYIASNSRYGHTHGYNLKIAPYNSGDKLCFGFNTTINSSGKGATQCLYGGDDYDRWYHIVGTFDGSFLKGYLNGNESSTSAEGTIDYNDYRTFIGNTPYGITAGVSGASFDGFIDEVRISSIARSAQWISTEYNNQDSPSTFYTTTGAEAGSVDWYNPPAGGQWKYRKKLTIDSTKVDDDLRDFPISISLTDGNIVNKAQADGDDLVITATDGTTKLSHEIEEFNEDTGEVVLHVKIPQLSQNTDTDIYLYYGNDAATNQQNVTDVWSNGYGGVWHMNEDSGTTVYDSTSNANHGTINTGSNLTVTDESFTSSFDVAVNLNKRELQSATETVTSSDGATTYTKDTDYTMDYANGTITVLSTGTMADATSYLIDYTYDNTGVAMGQDGQLGDAMEFDGVDDYIETVDFSWSVASSYSIQTYYKATDIAKENSIIGKANYEYTLRQDYDRLEFVHWASDESNSIVLVDESGSIVEDSWCGLSVVYDSAKTQSMLYKNSTEIDISTPSSDFENKNEPTLFGYGYSVSLNPKYAAGFIDEVRISSVARSSEWISTEYANQNSPSTFYTLDTEETTNPDWYDPPAGGDWNFRKEITIDAGQVDDDLVSFPVLVNQESDEYLAKETQADGGDIMFTDSSGTKLSHEIESYDSETGKLVVWIKFLHLSKSEDTVIHMYAGNRDIENQQNVVDVWSNGYTGVWHLSEEYWDSSGDYPAYNSVTSRHGTPSGGAATYYDESLGRRAGNFTATLENDHSNPAAIRFRNNQGELSFDSQAEEYTVQGWFKGTESTNGYILSYGEGESGSMDYFIRAISSNGGIRGSAGKTYADMNHNFQDGAWHQASLVNKNNSGTYQFKSFIDGSTYSTSWNDSGSERSSNNGFKIGCRDWTWGGNATAGYPGYINEVRVSDVARSSEWISTEYNNQHSPSSFYSITDLYSWDTTSPTNPTDITAYESDSKEVEISSGDWNNDASPHFEWSGAADPSGSGVDGYYLYYGTDPDADPASTSGIIEDDSSPHLSTNASYTLGKEMTTDSTYYLRVKTIDAANNVADSASTLFSYKYDNQAPNPPEYVDSDPAGCSTVDDFDLSWPEATDVGAAGIDKYQYKLSASGSLSNTTDLSVTVEPYQESDNVLYVRSVDNAGNLSEWRTGVYCVIGFVNITREPSAKAQPASLVINWVSDRKTNSYVKIYDEKGDDIITEQGSPNYVYDHEVEVVGLKPDANYQYQLIYMDENGNQKTSQLYQAKTSSPPQVQDLEIITLSPTSANISFKTTQPTISQLLYGLKSYDNSIKLNSSNATRYSYNLTNLEPDTTYYLTVKATTNDGFKFHSDKHILTTPAYPQISNLSFQPIKDAPTSTIEVSWQTNVKTSSALTITPKEKNKATKSASSAKLTKDHSLTISDLNDQTDYRLTASGRDEYGNQAISEPQTFTTAKDSRPPKISDIKLETSLTGTGSESKAQIVVSWQTDEPSTSQIAYGIGSGGDSYQAKTGQNDSLETNHTVIISQLEPQRTYHLKPISADESGNLAQGTDNVVITSQAPENVLDIIIDKLKETFGFLRNIRETLGI